MSEKRMTVKEVASELEISIGTVRAGLRTKAFDFGVAIPPERTGGNWRYIIFKDKFYNSIRVRKRLYVERK